MSAPLLQACKITKRFAGAAALREVDFSVCTGEVHAICGENGAGKSTLIRILSGYYPWHSFDGQLRWNGEPVHLDGVRSGEAMGVAVVHQEFSLIREMTIAENLFMGRLQQKNFRWDWAATIRETRKLLDRFEIEIDPETIVGKCGIPMQQMIEIAKALARSPQLLILDEPTAALGPAETELLFRSIDELRRQGVACIYISHKLDEVMSIADRVTVLRDGCTIATYPKSGCSETQIIRDMVGRPIEDIYPAKKPHRGADARMKIENLSAISETHRSVGLKNISLELREGEILGIGGLMGAGRSELLMHLYGLWGERSEGNVLIDGLPYADPTPRRSLQRGIMMVTEDRKRFGLIPGVSTHHNVSLSSMESVATLGWIDRVHEHDRNAAALASTRFRALSNDAMVERLSGGNQQKVVFARGFLCGPKILLLDEPTRGVDVGARCELYREFQQLADQGMSIMWVSSDLPELMGMCDRILVLHRGKMAGWFDRNSGFDAAALMAAALGQYVSAA